MLATGGALLPAWLTLPFAAALGAVFGSFLNVVIARVPNGESLMPRSRCPRCGHRIRNRDNIPVAGWLLLRGRCRDCREPIHWRYPAVEAATAAAFTAIVAWQGLDPVAVPLLILACASISLAIIDFDTMRLPDAITGPATAAIAASLIAISAATGTWDALGRGTLAGAAATVAYGALWAVSGGRAIGFGDVKIAFMLGLMAGWFSWPSAIVAVASGWLVGGIASGIALATRRIGPRSHIPFGPALIVGAWIGIAAGPWLAGAYLAAFGLA